MRSSKCCSGSGSAGSRPRTRSARAAATTPRRGGSRGHRGAGEEGELEVLQEFLPEPLAEHELEDIIDDAIAENGATSMRDFGRVMADVMPQVSGRADGSI